MDLSDNRGSRILRYMFMQDTASEEFIIAKDCFDLLSVSVLLLDPSGKIVFANKRACHVLEYEELKGKYLIKDLVEKKRQETTDKDIKKRLRIDSSADMILNLRTRTKHLRVIEAGTMRILDDENNCLGLLLSGKDITRDKLASQKLEKSKTEASKSADAKTKFLARVSHELRTPLNAIMGFTEQLLQTRLSERQREYISIIDESADFLLSLVNDILMLSKIEAKQVNIENHPFKISSTVSYVYKSLQDKASRKNLQFNVEIDDRADVVLSGDSFRLQQVLMNLLDNAIKFTDKGIVLLRCSLFDENNEEFFLKFEISDTGRGISPDNLEDIFNQYPQGEAVKSTGLGLPICKNLIELQGGCLSVSSKPDAGTTFNFVIPYRKAEKSAKPVFDRKLNPQLLKDKKILIVDDDTVNLLLGKIILDNFNCRYDSADCGQDAIGKINSGKYDVILLDIQMPDINGIEVANHVRIFRKDLETKIIALTAAALKDDIIEYKKAGIDDFLIKPFREIHLYNKICDVMNLSEEYMPKPKTEIILKREINPKPYNLSELRKIANNDEAFVNQTLNIFVENSRDAIVEFGKSLDDKNWKKTAELAHKILPSYRHLEVDSVVPKLMKLKSGTLTEIDDKHISRLIKDTIAEIKVVMASMKKEISE